MYDRTEDQRRVGYVEGLLTGREEQKELRVFGLTQVLSDRWESMRKIQRDVEMKRRRNWNSSGNQLYCCFMQLKLVVQYTWH